MEWKLYTSNALPGCQISTTMIPQRMPNLNTWPFHDFPEKF